MKKKGNTEWAASPYNCAPPPKSPYRRRRYTKPGTEPAATPLRVQNEGKSVNLSEQQMWQMMLQGAQQGSSKPGANKASLASQSTEITIASSYFESESDFWAKMSQGAHVEASVKGIRISPKRAAYIEAKKQKQKEDGGAQKDTHKHVPPYRERLGNEALVPTLAVPRPQTQGGAQTARESHHRGGIDRRVSVDGGAILEEHSGDGTWASSSLGQMATEHRRRSVDLSLEGYEAYRSGAGGAAGMPASMTPPTGGGRRVPQPPPGAGGSPLALGGVELPGEQLPWLIPRARLSIERVGVVDAVTAALPEMDPESWREARIQARKESLSYQVRATLNE